MHELEYVDHGRRFLEKYSVPSRRRRQPLRTREIMKGLPEVHPRTETGDVPRLTAVLVSSSQNSDDQGYSTSPDYDADYNTIRSRG